MQWLNEPSNWTAQGNRLCATSDAGTDFWRKTHDSGIRDHGHFYFESVVGNFSARVKQTAKFQSLYDQAGLMVRADECTWLKCGVEFMEGRHYASAVVTRDWSDWSVMPIENPASLWILCERKEATFSMRFSLDGIEYKTIRQAFLTEQSTLAVGMMLAAPKGSGFEVLFEDYSLTR